MTLLPKLHIRDLFWLVLVVAIGCGWLQHYRVMQYRLEAADRAGRRYVVTDLALRRLGYVVDEKGKLHPWDR